MSKKMIILLITVVVIVSALIFLFLPKTYTITVYNSRYFEACDSSEDTTQQQCKKLEPPSVIEKSEPNILSWWNKIQIQRKFSTSEVSVK